MSEPEFFELRNYLNSKNSLIRLIQVQTNISVRSFPGVGVVGTVADGYLTFNDDTILSAVSFHAGNSFSVQLKVIIKALPSISVKK